MKLIITEVQLSKVLNILMEQYIEDPYFKDNDIYDYDANQSEINDFNKLDKSKYSEFRGFDVPKDPNKVDPNKNFGIKLPKQNRKSYDTVKFTGKAQLVFMRPDGVDVVVKEGPVGVIENLKRIKQQANKDESHRYRVKYISNF